MKAGVIGKPDRNFGPIDSFTESTTIDNGTELSACLEIRRTETTDQGFTVQSGRAAIQEPSSEEEVSIDPRDNSITVSENANKIETKYTEFIIIPGSFVVVDRGEGRFVFSMISGQTASSTIKPAEIDLTGLIQSYETESRDASATPWQVGFYGSDGGADKGVLYGKAVLSDDSLGAAVRSLPKNQLGLDIKTNSSEIKMTATESGYVEVYQPSNFDTSEYASFIVEHILPHTGAEDGTEAN